MKILIQPLNIKHIEYLNNKDIDGYIIGLDKYSIFQSLKLKISEIKKLNTNKELFIAINKPIYNNELEDLKKKLIELSKLNINGILFEDISIYNINKNLNLNLNLIWNQMHIPTNYDSCNYWNKKGVVGAYLSTELMLQDFIDIKKNTNMLIMINLYGYMPMFESSRTLITNYLKYIKKSKKNDIYYLNDKSSDKYYIVYEEYNNTFILNEILNGINQFKEVIDNNIDYVVLNGVFNDLKEFNTVIDEYILVKNGENINRKNTNTGFLFKESVFKVKE